MTCFQIAARLMALTVLTVTLAPASAQTPEPLARLLSQIPVDSGEIVTLFDLDAARAQIAPLGWKTQKADRDVLPFAMLSALGGFDKDSIMIFQDGAREELGFSFYDFGQVADWGDLPSVSLIATGLDGSANAIGTALSARDFETTQYNGQTVWHRQDDFAIDFQRRNEDPFTGRLGQSSRFTLVGDDLLFARAWPEMRGLIDGGPNLAEDDDAAAILQAGYSFAEAGQLVGAVLIGSQPVRTPDPTLLLQQTTREPGQKGAATPALPPGFELPGLPVFLRYGLLLWQDGATTTGAIVIPYIRRDTAETARENFTNLLGGMQSLAVKKPFDELLPPDRRFEIVETGNRAVLVLAFSQTEALENPLRLTTFMRTPQSRLLNMVYRRDLDLLIGRDG